VKSLFISAVLLGLTATGCLGSVVFSIVTASPNNYCHFNIAPDAVNCVSDSGVEGRAAISASPFADGLGFTFNVTFDMGPEWFQSFGDVELLAGAGFHPATARFYTMTVLEQGTCTSNIETVCSRFDFGFSTVYPPDPVGIFTSAPQLQRITGLTLGNPDLHEVYFFLNHTTLPNEHTSISGSVHIESVTFTSVPEPSSVASSH
jgi:hypothetical protein